MRENEIEKIREKIEMMIKKNGIAWKKIDNSSLSHVIKTYIAQNVLPNICDT